jgi:hypothetical protein
LPSTVAACSFSERVVFATKAIIYIGEGVPRFETRGGAVWDGLGAVPLERPIPPNATEGVPYRVQFPDTLA